MKSVLIVDDEIDIQSSLSFALKDEGYEILTADSPSQAELILKHNTVDVVLLDIWFPEGDGVELLERLRLQHPELITIMMSGHGNIELALKSIRLGAYDFLEKPLELEKVLLLLRNASEAIDLKTENLRLAKELHGSDDLIGDSAEIAKLRTEIERAAKAASHIMISGENGSGKEKVARILHSKFSGKPGPFVAINCAAIPEALFESEIFGHERGAFTGATHRKIGRLEQAAKGVLFFDEISELSLNAQASLLRVLEEKQFERLGGRAVMGLQARVLAASNKDLSLAIKEGRFREDLYFRLNVVELNVPSLRTRVEDIEPLASHFVLSLAEDYSRKVAPTISSELLEWMKSYDWPGNVRELRNLIERMYILYPEAETLCIDQLPEELQSWTGRIGAESFLPLSGQAAKGTLRQLRGHFESWVLDERLKEFNGNVTRAAESLGIERAHLHRKMKTYGINAQSSRLEGNTEST